MLYRFGHLELDEEAFELRKDGAPLRVQPKVLKVLLHLVQNRERVIPSEELLAVAWPDAAVAENSLARAVSLARGAIRRGSDADIANLPRRGYRFRGAVEAVRARGGPAPRADAYVGRARLLARLEAALGAALTGGGGRVLLLAGEAGSGKTRTASLLLDHARAAGALALSAGGARPWPALLRALRAADHFAFNSLAPVHRRALARGADDSAALAEAASALVVRTASARPLALGLDDLHVAGTESLRLLEAIAEAIARARVAVVATCREDDLGADALARLPRVRSVERWALEGLSLGEVGELVRAASGDADPELVGALERLTHGNPLLVHESLRSLEARSLLGRSFTAAEWESLLPSGIRHLIEPRLRALHPAARELVACAATLGLECERETLARTSGGAGGFEERLERCTAAGLLQARAGGARVGFTHPLVREALYAELVPAGARRRELHLRAFHACASDSAARASHACEAAPLVPPRDAAALASAEASHSLRRLEFEAAAVWAQRALDALESADAGPTERAEVMIALAAAQSHVQGVESARVTSRLAADLARTAARPDLFARAALVFAHRPNASGQGDRETIGLLEEAHAESERVDRATAVRVASRLAAELRYAQPERARAMSDGAAERAQQLGDAAVLAQTLDDASFVRTSAADPERWLALNRDLVRAARAANDLELELLGQKGCVTALLESNETRSLDGELRALAHTAARLDTPYARWLRATLAAMRALLDGDLRAAESHIAESSEWGMQAESPDVALELQAQLAYLRVEQGRAAEIEDAVRIQARRHPDQPTWRAALARVLAASHRQSEAARELAQLGRLDFLDVPRDRGWLPTLALASEVAAVTLDGRSAASLYTALSPHASLSIVAGSGLVYLGSVAHFLGLDAGVLGRWDAAVAHFDEAIRVAECVGARLWKARGELGLARALAARDSSGDRARAAQLAARAHAVATERGWPALATEALPLAVSASQARRAPRQRRA